MTDPNQPQFLNDTAKADYQAYLNWKSQQAPVAPNAPIEPYRSLHEYQADIKKPAWGLMEAHRTQCDPAFRQHCYKRLQATVAAGIDLNLRCFENGRRIY